MWGVCHGDTDQMGKVDMTVTMARLLALTSLLNTGTRV